MQIKSLVMRYKYSITLAIFIIVCLSIGGSYLTNVLCGAIGCFLFAIDEHCYDEPDVHLYLYKWIVLFLALAVLAQTVSNILINQ